MKELDLKKYLKKYSGKEADFFRFNGNYGDSVIWHGTMNLLNDMNIRVNNVSVVSKVKNSTLFIDGGGNFVDYYDDVRDFLEKKHGSYKKIIILPHTIYGQKQIKILGEIKNAAIFCREKISAEFCMQYAKMSEVYMWHDCAFYNRFNKNNNGQGILNVFREDCESSVKFRPENTIDISKNGYATKDLDKFIDVINRHSVVNTDRLHVAITATLLEKQVNLYPNSYFKNKAVYDYSLKKYSNIKFIESL